MTSNVIYGLNTDYDVNIVNGINMVMILIIIHGLNTDYDVSIVSGINMVMIQA